MKVSVECMSVEIKFNYIDKCGCWKEFHRGQCCCVCKHHVMVKTNCANVENVKTDNHCGCHKDMGFYVCCAPIETDLKGVVIAGSHGMCELYDKEISG